MNEWCISGHDKGMELSRYGKPPTSPPGEFAAEVIVMLNHFSDTDSLSPQEIAAYV